MLSNTWWSSLGDIGIDYFGLMWFRCGNWAGTRCGCLMPCMKSEAVHLKVPHHGHWFGLADAAWNHGHVRREVERMFWKWFKHCQGQPRTFTLESRLGDRHAERYICHACYAAVLQSSAPLIWFMRKLDQICPKKHALVDLPTNTSWWNLKYNVKWRGKNPKTSLGTGLLRRHHSFGLDL